MRTPETRTKYGPTGPLMNHLVTRFTGLFLGRLIDLLARIRVSAGDSDSVSALNLLEVHCKTTFARTLLGRSLGRKTIPDRHAAWGSAGKNMWLCGKPGAQNKIGVKCTRN
jgi:hypothetical protein